MPRPLRPDGKLQVSLFVSNGHRYAASQTSVKHPQTGKYTHSKTIYGSVTEDLAFKPNLRFYTLDPKVRENLAFPEAWNLSELEHLGAAGDVPQKRGRPSYEGESVNRLYGDVLLLELVAEKTGVRSDLQKVFGDSPLVDDLLTLAYYEILSDGCYNHLASWQRVHKTPSRRSLDPDDITRLTQGITEGHKQRFFACRSSRVGPSDWMGIDSTSVSVYGSSLADRKWGKNREHDLLPQVNVLVLYSLESHMPVYYRRMPGNIPDTRTLRVTLKELELLDFGRPHLVLDRGYLSQECQELLVKKGYAFMVMAKVSDSYIHEAIAAVDVDELSTWHHWIDPHGVYAMEGSYPFQVRVKGEARDVAPLRMCLFFDQELNAVQRKELSSRLNLMHRSLEHMLQDAEEVSEDTAKKLSAYFTLKFKPESKILASYEENPKLVKNAYLTSGFFAILCNRISPSMLPLQGVLDRYRLRDEQEKCFWEVKSLQTGRRFRSSTEPSTDGRLFIQFVALTLNTYIDEVIARNDLYKQFPTKRHMFEEMQCVRCIEHPRRAKIVTEFVGKQVTIFDLFQFEIPKGSRPATTPRKRKKKESST